MKDYKKIPVRTWFLEKNAPFDCASDLFSQGFSLAEEDDISPDEYLKIYREAGSAYGWASRLMISRSELSEKLKRPENCLYVLRRGHDSAGFFEILLFADKAELLYFGLRPQYIGQGLGKELMQAVFCTATAQGIQKLQLHTCEYDHPKALDFYKKAGFIVYDEKITEEYYPVDFTKKIN